LHVTFSLSNILDLDLSIQADNMEGNIRYQVEKNNADFKHSHTAVLNGVELFF